MLLFVACFWGGNSYVHGQTSLASQVAVPAVLADWAWIGELHNRSLSAYHQARGEMADSSAAQVLMQVAEQMATEFPAVRTPAFQNRAADILARTNDLQPAQVYRALGLDAHQIAYIEDLMAMPDNLSPTEAAAYITQVATRISADTHLSTSRQGLPLACASIALHSAHYWQDYYLLDDDSFMFERDKRDTIINGDTLKLDKKGRVIPPFGKVVRADFYGLLKGLLGGTIIWVGSQMDSIQFQQGLALGIVFAAVFPAAESAVYNWRYRRERIKNQFGDDDELDHWEIYQN